MQLKSCRWLSVCISPHLNAIVKALAQRFNDFVFLFVTEDQGAMRRNVGWSLETSYQTQKYNNDVEAFVATDLFIDNIRQLEVLEQRAKFGKISVYMGERWFKPPLGVLRLFMPSYQKMAKRFCRIFKSGKLLIFPSGIHAVRDMLRMVAFFNGNWRNFIYTPNVAFESRPGGRIFDLKTAYKLGLISHDEYKIGMKMGFVQIQQAKWNEQSYSTAFKNIFLGGYIVESEGVTLQTVQRLKCIQDGTPQRPFRILWVGRMLDWKRADILIKATCHLIAKGYHISLLVVGEGPECQKWMKMARGVKRELKDAVHQRINTGDMNCLNEVFSNQSITFSPYLKSHIVQQLMREMIDLYVMSSDGGEGWGAVVPEALICDCPILSTIEAGSSATLLPPKLLYPAKSVKLLVKRLEMLQFSTGDNQSRFWTGEQYATNLLKVLQDGEE